MNKPDLIYPADWRRTCSSSSSAAVGEALELEQILELPGQVTAMANKLFTPRGGTLYCHVVRVRVQLIGHLQPCMTEIYLHIVARMAD